ncbi:MAG: alpha/beta hydrolase [Aquabacterium sp.]|nr:alpha/beta hydrolase [Aquabacterium sp.]
MMVRIGLYTAALLGLLVSWALWFAPITVGSWLYAQNARIEAVLAGLSEHTLEMDGVGWRYYARHETQPGPCVVLIHGFTAEASNWFRMAMRLDKGRCLIVADLPGFGQTKTPSGLSYRIPIQSQRLHRLLSAVRPTGAFDLVGSSMGGHIALRMALDTPYRIRSLVLMDAGGVTSPQPSEQDQRVLAGDRNAFDIHHPAEFEAFLHLGMNKVPWMPTSVRDALAATFIARNAHHQEIFTQIYHHDLEDTRLGQLRMPVLVIWGDQDNLLHTSMANVFHRGISGSRLVVMPGIGHLPMMEAPSATASTLEQFWNGLEPPSQPAQ